MTTAYQEMSLLINDYEMRPPLTQKLFYVSQQLNPSETMMNWFYLAKNSYELNDNYSGLPLIDATQEDEFYSVSHKE